MSTASDASDGLPDYDVVVVGAGIAGIYGIIRFRNQGLRVLGIEGASDVGGVWYHNGYPGARVDVESINYCYVFDEQLYRDSVFTERFAAQPELLAYLNGVADRFDVRRNVWFDTWVSGAQWDPQRDLWVISTDTGRTVTSRYLVTASGQLSKPRRPDFAGLEDFAGTWYQTSRWPRDHVDFEGRRVAVVGTGSTGVQTTTVVSRVAAQTYVFQRTPHFVIPTNNHPADLEKHARLAGKFDAFVAELMRTGAGILMPPSAGKARDYTEEEQQLLLEERYAFGGQSFLGLFSETGVDIEINDLVAEFVRSRIRQRVNDPATAEKLMPREYPIGVRRPCFDTGYYESFNLDTVELVDIKADPIERITRTGIKTRDAHYEVDSIIFALGFESFTGSIDNMNIRNENGRRPTDNWVRGPRTYLGLMTTGFPNLFNITGPGSPSVLSNFFVANPQQIDFIGGLIDYAKAGGHRRIEASDAAEEAWTRHSAEVAEPLLRRVFPNYMTHVNADDGTKVFIPYIGGFGNYVAECNKVAANGFDGFILS
jgi:cation diffusion facilitator CzcD-associated flavoprotein CzcO